MVSRDRHSAIFNISETSLRAQVGKDTYKSATTFWPQVLLDKTQSGCARENHSQPSHYRHALRSKYKGAHPPVPLPNLNIAKHTKIIIIIDKMERKNNERIVR